MVSLLKNLQRRSSSVSLLKSLFSTTSTVMSSSSTAFEQAKDRLEKSNIDVDNQVKLKLYGLFKQSTQGACSIPKPGLTDFVGKAKWTAWSQLEQMSKEDAQKQYVQVVNDLLKDLPTSSSSSTAPEVSSSSARQTQNSPSEEHIILDKKSARHWEIVLNRQEKFNAITRPMYERLIQIFSEAEKDEQLVLISLVGRGRFYSSGTDLADFAKMATSTTTDLKQSVELGQKMLETYIRKYIECSKILVAFINGPAVGISVSVLGLFDGVYASSSSSFITPFTRTAQSAEGCSSYTFPRLMGSLHAKEMLLFDRKLTAQEAYERGLVTKVIDESSFDQEKQKICEHILSLPRGSLLQSKKLIQQWNIETLVKVNEQEVETLKQRWLTEEFVQAMMEFMRSRKKSKL
ncbi:unnamed protein product [Didymodactylos carnosus]|nr:unnamed protein product [Didymodactylos carnosus]CAF3734605.1 unnamed protein product [Didymodactylos carnosus]